MPGKKPKERQRYMLRINDTFVEVTRAVYLAWYQAGRKERYQVEKMQRHGVCSMEELQEKGYDCSFSVVSPEEIVIRLSEIQELEKALGYLTKEDKREIGLHKLIMEAGDIIAQKHMEEYVNRCVVKFILSESKYGYIGSGISDVFERYYEMFNDNTWNLLFENIVTRFAESDYGIIASLWGDFTIFSIYYLSRIDKDKIKALFDCLCKTHESLSSANGRVKIKEEKLILDENITSLSDMVNFQLNI